MKKKILYLITKSNFGGAQRYVYELATSLPKDSYDVAVAFGGVGEKGADAGSLKIMLNTAGIRTMFLSRFARDIDVVNDFKLFFDILALLKKEQPDILHINSSKAGGLGALAGRIAGTQRIVFTAHGWPHQEKRPLFQKGIIWLVSWATVMLSHATIAVSKNDFRTAPAFLKKHSLHHIANGIAPFVVLPRETARAELASVTGKYLAENVTIGAIAELTKNKGLEYLVRAMPHVPHATLIIVGQGEERGRLELLAAETGVHERVIFAGFIPEARRLLKAFDIYALSSLKEGLPYTLLEAGAAGLPIVATEVGGVPEIVINNTNGVLVPKENSAKIAEALNSLIQETSKRELFGSAGQAHVTDAFSFARMQKETLALYA